MFIIQLPELKQSNNLFNNKNVHERHKKAEKIQLVVFIANHCDLLLGCFPLHQSRNA